MKTQTQEVTCQELTDLPNDPPRGRTADPSLNMQGSLYYKLQLVVHLFPSVQAAVVPAKHKRASPLRGRVRPERNPGAKMRYFPTNIQYLVPPMSQNRGTVVNKTDAVLPDLEDSFCQERQTNKKQCIF